MYDILYQEVKVGDYLAYCDTKKQRLGLMRVDDIEKDRATCTRLIGGCHHRLSVVKISAQDKIMIVYPPQFIQSCFNSSDDRELYSKTISRLY